MPELPEVETLVRDMAPGLIGRTIVSISIAKPKLFRATPGLAEDVLAGRRIEHIRRRGKLTVWEVSDGLALVLHLKLAGQLVHRAADGTEVGHGGHPVPKWGSPLPHKATHITVCLDDGSVLYLTDIRQFSRLHLMPAHDVIAFFTKQKIGVEPLTPQFTARQFGERLRRRSIPLKTTIMDQSVVGGIGNIYADESLWRARLHPRRPANSLSDTEIARLHRAIRAVLDYAVREGVAFVPQGKAISDRAFPYAHGRAGTPCPRCGTTFVKEWVGGRGTHYCPKCQKLQAGRQPPTSDNA
ncbi:MAG: bifunctional DNA-formamidopyrimidine glycosylase/DNA-(apurinic or apyrimidinic site) lyase [Chloroflexota bacterium]